MGLGERLLDASGDTATSFSAPLRFNLSFIPGTTLPMDHGNAFRYR